MLDRDAHHHQEANLINNENDNPQITSAVAGTCLSNKTIPPVDLPTTLVDTDGRPYSRKDHKESKDNCYWFSYYRCKFFRSAKCTRTFYTPFYV